MLDLDKIHELSLGIDEHLRKLTGFTDLLKEIKVSLNEIKNSQEKNYMQELVKLREDYEEINNQLKLRGLPESSRYEQQFESIRKEVSKEEWPLAVDPDCICEDEEKKSIRASAILDMYVAEYLKDKKFLDFGCGEGHVAHEANKRETALSIGYDVNKQWSFDDDPDKMFFTTDFEFVKNNGPYDVILLFDVLDHCTEDPIDLLNKIKPLLKNEGRLYVKCHPWCSRHGSHLYRQLNKAFLHLIMDEVELTRFAGVNSEHCIKINKPLETYRYWFESTGYEIKSELPQITKVEDFFKQVNSTGNKIKDHWEEGEIPENHMQIDFVDYVLENSTSKNQIF